MFRVSKTGGRSRTMVTIDGQLSGESIQAVETCCDQAMANGKPVHLFLRDVSTIDQAGRALLCRLAAKGVRLLARGVYTAHLVRALSPAGAEAWNASVVAGNPNGPAAG
jgi:ABC-type transporter Mla MlaB component